MLLNGSVEAAEKMSLLKKRANFQNYIPEIAEQYIGIPYGFGKGFEKSLAAVDNSHLFYLIYNSAARQAGLRISGYMPIKDLLRHTKKIQRHYFLSHRTPQCPVDSRVRGKMGHIVQFHGQEYYPVGPIFTRYQKQIPGADTELWDPDGCRDH